MSLEDSFASADDEQDLVWHEATEEARAALFGISQKRPREEYLGFEIASAVSYIGEDRMFPLDMTLLLKSIMPDKDMFVIDAGRYGVHEIPFRNIVEESLAQRTMSDVYPIVQDRKGPFPPSFSAN